ncbi:DUF4325 domain-containing protein [Candidatus Parcubacteria bacterium]|nr:DUF4325 domain-containing protein [Candidatus Parcubacteria bacterium]
MDLKNFILKKAGERIKFKTSDILKDLNQKFSRQHISSIICAMVKEGLLIKGGTTINAFYALPKKFPLSENIIKRKFKNANLEESEIFNKLQEQTAIIKGLEENVSSILFYAFTEMLNNAIEHSSSKYIEIELKKTPDKLSFTVNDFGIGVFKNIMKKRKLNSEMKAIQDLLKGKTTTQPKAHSGEGIFFTSKIGDLFTLESFGYRLRIDNDLDDFFIEKVKPMKKGTKVCFSISLNSKRHLNDIFKEFQTNPEEPAFDKTKITVRLYTMGTIYISRSQARRILSGLTKYKEVILDFNKVPTVGQAFADEIFRVFKQNHPEVLIKPINMAEPVKFMIDRTC